MTDLMYGTLNLIPKSDYLIAY